MLASRAKMTGIHRAEDACMQVAAVQRAATPRSGGSALRLVEDAALFRSVQKFAPVGARPGAPGLAYQAVRAKGERMLSPHDRLCIRLQRFHKRALGDVCCWTPSQ